MRLRPLPESHVKPRHTLSFALATLAATALLVWVPMAQAALLTLPR